MNHSNNDANKSEEKNKKNRLSKDNRKLTNQKKQNQIDDSKSEMIVEKQIPVNKLNSENDM